MDLLRYFRLHYGNIHGTHAERWRQRQTVPSQDSFAERIALRQMNLPPLPSLMALAYFHGLQLLPNAPGSTLPLWRTRGSPKIHRLLNRLLREDFNTPSHRLSPQHIENKPLTKNVYAASCGMDKADNVNNPLKLKDLSDN